MAVDELSIGPIPRSRADSFERTLTKLYPGVDQSKTPLPRRLSIDPSHRGEHIIISEDCLQVRYHCESAQTKKHDPGSVRSNVCIPVSCGVYYYETTIVSKGKDGLIAVGLSTANFQFKKLPGWEKDSYGYHADDGYFFKSKSSGDEYGPTFSTGDTVGCCIDFHTQSCFFTKNGNPLGEALACYKDLPSVLFPTIGLKSNMEMVEVNFGQRPFIFNFEDYIFKCRLKQLRLLSRSDLVSLDTALLSNCSFEQHDNNSTKAAVNKVISSYLYNRGYHETSSAMETSSGQPASTVSIEKIASQRKRKQIMSLCMEGGRIPEVQEIIVNSFPRLFEHDKWILFLLNCQHFIEMVSGVVSPDAKLVGHHLSPKISRPSRSISPRAQEETNGGTAMEVGDGTNGSINPTNGHTNGSTTAKVSETSRKMPQPCLGPDSNPSQHKLLQIITFGRSLNSLAKEVAVSHPVALDYVTECFGIMAHRNLDDKNACRLKNLFKKTHREQLAQAVNAAILEFEGEGCNSLLENCLGHVYSCFKVTSSRNMPEAMSIDFVGALVEPPSSVPTSFPSRGPLRMSGGHKFPISHASSLSSSAGAGQITSSKH